MKKIINGEAHYIVYAVYRGENLKEMDFNAADWYETLEDAMDAVGDWRWEFIKQAKANGWQGVQWGDTLAEVVAMDVGPEEEQWNVPIKFKLNGRIEARDAAAMRGLNRLGLKIFW